MLHIDEELNRLREKLLEMWDLVDHQLNSGREAVMNADHELADRIIKLERKVNNYDIKIDRMCENFLALYTPVAVDLRAVLALLKINTNLERIGDTAESMAHFVKKLDRPFTPELVELTNMMVMYDQALAMFRDCRVALVQDDPKLAKEVIKLDKALNKIYRKSDRVITKYLQANSDQIPEALAIFSIIKKLERAGDQVTNMAEEIIFYREAKVVKHKRKKKKKDD
ncbi:phosphate signaling complex protein PhoU [Pontibacter ramchanderi]|uniref:Phosphate-specific transport system accessory protein PhoU n=1 Tax=Pontibacter ramchanderi TaxID=1179743 RepID=A0A2N3UBU4_9BACT|nr:phosphate signaling complex protein PhoU [Pontibacter ramchanderi]PKV66850.1 phosphate transport system protein [Pontibacter ramchanderi]